jgi:repressor LexA
MTPRLTPKQKRLLDYIRAASEANGYAPSQQEIADHFGFRSLGTVQNYLVRLEREGFLRRIWNAKRALEPVELKREVHEIAGAELPLLGFVAAGRPIEAVASQDAVEVPPSMIRRGENFALRVKGDSMIGDGILDGDYVIVCRRPTAEMGQTVVALVDGEATVKHFHKTGAGVELRSANPAYPTILVGPEQDFRIEGVVVGVIRHCR